MAHRQTIRQLGSDGIRQQSETPLKKQNKTQSMCHKATVSAKKQACVWTGMRTKSGRQHDRKAKINHTTSDQFDPARQRQHKKKNKTKKPYVHIRAIRNHHCSNTVHPSWARGTERQNRIAIKDKIKHDEYKTHFTLPTTLQTLLSCHLCIQPP